MALQHNSGNFPGLLISNRYKLEYLLTETPKTEIWEALDLVLDRQISIKIIHSGDIPIGAGRLNTPGILTIFDITNHQGSAVVVTEKIDAIPLHQIIDSKEKLSPVEVQTILITVAKIIEKAHLQGVPHFSLTATNILISNSGEIYLTDFRGQVDGGGPFDPQHDLKSLRSLLKELLKLCPRLSIPDHLWKLSNEQSVSSPKSVLEFRIVLEKKLSTIKKPRKYLPLLFCSLLIGVVALSAWVLIVGG